MLLTASRTGSSTVDKFSVCGFSVFAVVVVSTVSSSGVYAEASVVASKISAVLSFVSAPGSVGSLRSTGRILVSSFSSWGLDIEGGFSEIEPKHFFTTNA